MLLRFAVGNFLSFKETVELKMAAGKSRKHNNHVSIVGDEKRILKGAFIFGANAAGKSNLVRAMDFARLAIVNGVGIEECYKKWFRVDSAYRDKPGVFQFDIFVSGHFYSYGFAISYRRGEIEEEWLYRIADNREERVFERARNNDGIMKVIGEMEFDNDAEKNQFEVYAEAIGSDEMRSKMFLSDMALRSSRESKSFRLFRDIRRWFNDLLIIYPESRYLGFSNLVRNDVDRTSFERLIKSFDTGIDKLVRSDKNLNVTFEDMPEEIKKVLMANKQKSDVERENEIVFINDQGAFYEISLLNDSLRITEVVSDHGNQEDLFEHADESDGTKRLFDLLPIYYTLHASRVIIIDELDRSLHTKASLELINRFYEESDGLASQLIATTHDLNVFDLDILRQDEIWMVERMDDNSSKLKPLSYYKPQDDRDVKRDYLIGRYGAVPIFDRLTLMEDEG